MNKKKQLEEILIYEGLDKDTFWKDYNPYDDEFYINIFLDVISEKIDYIFITAPGCESYGMIFYYSKKLKKYIVINFDYCFFDIDTFSDFIRTVNEFEKEAEAIELKIKNGVSDE